jgi:hypothetical protein
LNETEREMPQGFFDETKATARLPNLDIEIVCGRSLAWDTERITISLQAAPSFAAFGRFLEAANPFLFWMRFAKRLGHRGLAFSRRSFRQTAFPRRRKPAGLSPHRTARAPDKQVRGFSFAAVHDAREERPISQRRWMRPGLRGLEPGTICVHIE